MRTAVLLLGALAVVAVGVACTAGTPAQQKTIDRTGYEVRWTDLSPCEDTEVRDHACGTLTVPLDRSHPDTATVSLPVLVAGNRSADRTLLMLTGGPGQPGVALAPRILPTLSALRDDFRIVMLDQRGTGANALRCPKLQEQVGQSDLEVPTAGAVAECGRKLGPDRAHYATGDTVADLEDLRSALGVRHWAVDGVSYGSFVAQRYAAAHRDHVSALVLDSVVPVAGFDPMMVDVFSEYARVLRDVCTASGCPGDPAADLHTAVARYGLGTRLLDVLAVISIVDPTFADVPALLHRAASGDPEPLKEFLEGFESGSSGPAERLSQGLHASTLCLDARFPWPGADTPLAERTSAADRRVRRLSDTRLYPFDDRTARANGIVFTCERWPPVPDPDRSVGYRAIRGVDTLLLAGGHDLSTPLVWAERAHRRLPDSTLRVFAEAGHSLQSEVPAARTAVAAFLRDQ